MMKMTFICVNPCVSVAEDFRKLMDKQLILKELIPAIPQLQAIYVFGSVASGDAHVNSDLDLAVLSTELIDEVLLWDLSQQLAVQLGHDVDLVDLSKASTVMRMQIISSGQLLYCLDDRALSVFADYVYSAYTRFNAERSEILRDIQQRGSVYGQ